MRNLLFFNMDLYKKTEPQILFKFVAGEKGYSIAVKSLVGDFLEKTISCGPRPEVREIYEYTPNRNKYKGDIDVHRLRTFATQTLVIMHDGSRKKLLEVLTEFEIL